MTDDRLREAERLYSETSSVQDEARLLLERVRAGRLPLERLELAAELRYEPAVLAMGSPRRPSVHSLGDLFASLARFGVEVFVRAALALTPGEAGPEGHSERTKACLAAVAAWLACPCERHARELEPHAVANTRGAARLAAHAAAGLKTPAELLEDG